MCCGAFLAKATLLAAFFDAVSVPVSVDCTGAVCASSWTAVSPFLVSRAITAALNALSVSSISGGKGIPSSFGQSRCSLWLVRSSSSSVPVSGSKKVGTGAVVGAVVGGFSTAGVNEAGVREAACFSRARTFFAAFLQMVSMVTEKGKCRSQRSQTEMTCGQ